MVGKNASGRGHGEDMPGLCEIPGSAGMLAPGAGVSERGHETLAQRAWASADCPGCLAAGKALTADKFYDAIGGGPLPLGCTPDAASCEIFRYRLVHGIKTRCDCGDEVVND